MTPEAKAVIGIALIGVGSIVLIRIAAEVFVRWLETRGRDGL